MNKLETIFWKVAKRIIKKGYGYCDVRDGQVFMLEGRCSACDASEVQDWVDGHIELINYKF